MRGKKACGLVYGVNNNADYVSIYLLSPDYYLAIDACIVCFDDSPLPKMLHL